MKKALYIALAVLVLTVSIFPICSQAAAVGEVVYEENFENGETDISPTSDKTGTNVIKSEDGNHYLHFNGYGENRYSLSCFGPYVADFDFSFKIRQTIHNGSWSYCMALFHIDWNVNAYRVDLYEDHVRLVFDNGVDDETAFGSYDSFGVSNDKWSTVQVFGRGNEYTVVMDGELVGQFTSDERDEGNFGFCGWQTEFDVDDIKIIEYVDGTAPPVNSLVDGMGEETDNRDIIENERESRKMLDTLIDAVSSLGGFAILLYISLAIAALAVIVIVVILIVSAIKKRRKKE